jgi:hypothetical protein
MIRGRVDSPVDATNDRNPRIDDKELDVVDHQGSHWVVDDIDTLPSKQRGGAGARQLRRVVDDRDRDASPSCGDERDSERMLTELVDLHVDAEPGAIDQSAQARERGRTAAQQRQLVAAEGDRGRRPQQWRCRQRGRDESY